MSAEQGRQFGVGRFARLRRCVDVNSTSGARGHPHSVPGVAGGKGCCSATL